MPLFGSGKRTDTACDHEAKINRFLQKVDDSGSKWYESIGIGSKQDIDEQLERLFSWGERIWAERNSLSSQRNSLASQRDGLSRQLSEAETKIKGLETDLATAQAKLRELEENSKRMRLQHNGELNNLKSTYTSAIKQEQHVHGREVRKLVGELLVNQDDNMGWTDEKLKIRFRKLQTLISSLVSPRRNAEFRISSDHQVTRDLDPTGFLGRASKSKAHFLLQSIIWTVLYDHYFSAPFGFGILGSGESQKWLFDKFSSWAKLLGQASDNASSTLEVYNVFDRSQLVNTWRATTFQCINESFANPSARAQAHTKSIAALMMENANQVIARITSVLSHALRVSGSSPPASLDEEIRQIALESLDLAMQFGLHAARLELIKPSRGDEIRIGSSVHDCEDGDCDKGTRHVVDLVTLPGLQIIGDGRSETTFKRVLIPCEIYPHQ